MHSRIAAKDGAKFGTVENLDHRQPVTQATDLVSAIAPGLAGGHEKSGASGTDLGTHLLEPHHRLTGAARQTDRVQAAAEQQSLDPVGQIGGHANLTTGGLGE